MPSLTKRWQVAARISEEADRALCDFQPNRIMRQILYSRGYKSPEAASLYLDARIPPGTNPFNMLGMSQAVTRIFKAIQEQEQIAIYGDYDADGVTSTALLVKALQSLGAQASGYIPNRFDEGYGLNTEALSSLKERGVGLVITVDCGIRSPAETAYAKLIGLDIILTDHHHPGGELPVAYAVINPKQEGDSYPDKDLAGVGLAYKLASALYNYVYEQEPARLRSEINADHLLDLVAVGTVADLAPLTGENRALVRMGLERIREKPRQGLLSLILAAGLKPEKITTTEIGFMIGPRLNAAGRLESALDAYDLLISDDQYVTGLLAQKLHNQNRERQDLTRKMQIEAEEKAFAEEANPLLLFAASPEFNPGVVGLAASRLSELHYRPAIVAFQGESFTRASCRSIKEFHITNALDQCADILEHHGGHAAAAGFTVKNENLPELLRRLRLITKEQLSSLDLCPILNADAEVLLEEMKPALLEELDKLQPTGYSNPQPVFVSRNVRVKSANPVGKDGSHMKLKIIDRKGFVFDGIAFRQADRINDLRVKPDVDVMFTFERNEYNGPVGYQLNIKDIKPQGIPD